MIRLFLAVLLALPMAAVYGQVDSTTDTGSVSMVVQKPIDTILSFKEFRNTTIIKRGTAPLLRLRLSGSALDTVKVKDLRAGRYTITGTLDTLIVDSMSVLTKQLVTNMWFRIKRK